MVNKIAVQYNFGEPLRGYNNIGLEGQPGSGSLVFIVLVLSSIIGFITIVAGLVFIYLVITGAIIYITAGGDKGKAEQARSRITTGLVGLTIVIAAVFLIDLLGYILRVDLLDPRGTILDLMSLID
jgi:hypothetical protein